MSQWTKVNWRRIFFVNTILAVLMFTPFLPISSYLHEYAIALFFFSNLAIILFVIFSIILVPVLLILFAYLVQLKKINTAWMIFYSLVTTFLLTFFIGASGLIQDIEGRMIISSMGTQVVESLEAYKLDHGAYPKLLADLVPKYMNRLPQSKIPAVKQYSFFDYHTQDDQFHLSFVIVNSIFESKVFIHYKGDLEKEGYDLKSTKFPNWKTYQRYEGH